MVCRQAAAKDQLLGLGWSNGQVVPIGVGPTARPSRRGLYVHARSECLGKLSGASLARGFRAAEAAQFDREIFATWVVRLAETKLQACVGLARRAGRVVLGVDAARSADGFCVVATDLAAATRDRLPATSWTFGDGESLGRSVGCGRVLALRIQGPWAKQAEYWQRVWYAAQSAATRIEGMG